MVLPAGLAEDPVDLVVGLESLDPGALLHGDGAQPPVSRLCRLRLELDDLRQGLLRLLEVSLGIVVGGQGIERAGIIGPHALRPPVVLDRFVAAAHGAEHLPQLQQGVEVGRVGLQHSAEPPQSVLLSPLHHRLEPLVEFLLHLDHPLLGPVAAVAVELDLQLPGQPEGHREPDAYREGGDDDGEDGRVGLAGQVEARPEQLLVPVEGQPDGREDPESERDPEKRADLHETSPILLFDPAECIITYDTALL